MQFSNYSGGIARDYSENRRMLQDAVGGDIFFEEEKRPYFQLQFEGQKYSGELRAIFTAATVIDICFYSEQPIQDNLVERVLEKFS